MDDVPAGAVLLLDGARGISIPSVFAELMHDNCGMKISGVLPEDLVALRGAVEDDAYWDIWGDVLACALLTDSGGKQYRLWQDGDLWLVPAETPKGN